MPRRNAKAYLGDIVESCDAIARFIADASLGRYEQDEYLRAAVERKLFIIGEAVNNLRELEPLAVHTLGDIAGIVKVRTILAHVYFGVQHDLVWDMASKDVPRLPLAAMEWLNSST